MHYLSASRQLYNFPRIQSNLFSARMAATRSAIGPKKQGLASPIGARLAQPDTADSIARSLTQLVEAGGNQAGPKVLPLRAVLKDGAVDSDFVWVARAIGNNLRLVLYYKEESPEAAQADMAREALPGVSIVAVREGADVILQLKVEAQLPNIETAAIQFNERDFVSFESPIIRTKNSKLETRFVVLPENPSADAALSPVEKLALLFLADAHKVLTAVGRAELYSQNPRLAGMLNNPAFTAFLAIPIKILEKLREALRNLQATALAA